MVNQSLFSPLVRTLQIFSSLIRKSSLNSKRNSKCWSSWYDNRLWRWKTLWRTRLSNNQIFRFKQK